MKKFRSIKNVQSIHPGMVVSKNVVLRNKYDTFVDKTCLYLVIGIFDMIDGKHARQFRRAMACVDCLMLSLDDQSMCKMIISNTQVLQKLIKTFA